MTSKRIRDILDLARSKSVVGRRSAVANLSTVYDNKSILAEITRNSVNVVPDTISWTDILHGVHNIVIMEGDRSTIRGGPARKKACELFLQTVIHANNTLNIFDLISFILQVLSSEIFSFCHTTYISILSSHILPVEKYRNNITREHWQELLKVCVSCYQDESSSVKKDKVLEVIQMLVQYGCPLSNLSLRARKLITFLVKVFEDMKSNDALIHSGFKLANTVCHEIAIESRLLLCQFGETIIPMCIDLTKFDIKYELFLILVQVHHPKGAIIGDGIGYAVNATAWKNTLRDICNMVVQNSKTQALSRNCIELGCEVFRQIVENPTALEEISSLIESQCTENPKRRRITSENGKLINMITGYTPERALPMLQIFAQLFKKYPTILTTKEFTSFLQTVSLFLMQSSSFPKIMDTLCELGIALVDVEQYLGIQETIGNNKLLWSEILDTVTSYLSTNHIQEAGHRFVQYLIMNGKVMNLSSLLKIYVLNIMSWSLPSLRSLLVVCSTTTLPESLSDFSVNSGSDQSIMTPLETQLLQWVSNIPWKKLLTLESIETISGLLIGLTLKSWQKVKQNLKKYIETYNVDKLSELEKCYLTTNFCIDIFKESTKADEDQTNKEQSMLTYKKDNLNVLYSHLENVFKSNDQKDTARILVVKCALIARIISDLKEMDAFPNGLHDFPLMPLFQNYLETIFQTLADSDLTKIRHKDIIHIMKVLRILFQSTRNRSVNQIIINYASVDALQKFYAFLQSRENNDTNNRSEDLEMNVDFDFGCSDKLMEQAHKEAERNSVIKTLSLYCCTASEDVLIDIQEQLLCSLLNSDRYDLQSNKDIEVLLMLFESISNSESSIHTENSVEGIMNLLIESFHYLYKNQVAARKVLQWIPNLVKIAMQFDQNACHIMKIVGYFHNLLQEKKKETKKSYGPAMYLDFVKCLEHLILLDPSFKFSKQNESTNKDVPIIEYLLDYINSPFYVVRLEAAHCVYKVFASNDIDYIHKVSFFEKMKILLKDSFIADRKIDDNEKVDEKITRTSSMLHVISAVIYRSDLFKCQALFVLIHLAAQKGVEVKYVRKMLQIVSKEEETIVENNLDYLLMNWWNVQQSLEKFPWDLTHCSTEEDFYVTYMHILLPVLMKNGNLSQAIELCNEQKISFERELERSFPTIIAWLLSKVSENSDSMAQNILLKLETNQKEFRSVRRFTDLVHENLDQIIVLLIKELQDEKHFSELLGMNVIFPESGFTRLSASVVDKCLLYMEIHFFVSGKLMHYLATERQDILQKVLLKLTRNIYDKNGEHKLKAFHQYIYFCNIIAKNIKDFQFEEISTFLIRDISFTLLYQIDEDDNQFAEVSCKYFHTFLQMVLPEKSAIIKEIFVPCIKTLTRSVCKNEKSSALHSLQFLIETQKDFFTEVIANLDFFPNKTVFEELRRIHNSLRYNSRESCNLETEIEHFLNVSSDNNFSGTESLVRLFDQLSSRREELSEQYKKLESLRGFAEDCASSKLHRLIRQLASLMGSADLQISQEAAKCLGLLGPGNLATMILLPDKINRTENSNRFEMLTHRILTLLSDLLNEKKIEIREASADVLYFVLSSYWGQNLMKRNYLNDFENAMDNTDLRLSIDYIRPFLIGTRTNAIEEIVQLEIYPELQEEFWIENSSSLYSDWIKKFSCMIAKCFRNFYMQSIIPILNLSVQFCEKILPWMVNALFDDPKLSNEICKCINRFFYYYFAPSNDESNLSNQFAERKNSFCTHESVHCMLNIVNFIWIQSERTVRLNLDYLSIAQGAQFCSAYFTSVLYAELWCDSFLKGNRAVGFTTIIDYIVERDPVRGKILQDIIREANVKIGDPDAIHGCGSTHLLDPAARIRHYVDLKQWDKAMLMQDIELSSGIDSTQDMLHVLQQTGLYFLLNHFTSSINDDKMSKYSSDYKFECAWRLGDWSLLESKQSAYSSQINVNSLNCEKNQSYYYYHYEALKFLHDNDKVGVKQAVDNARNCVIKYLRNISLESCKAVYPMLSQLQMLREIEEWSSANPFDYGERIRDWQYHDYIRNNDFEYIEPLFAQRIAICKMKQSHEVDKIVKDTLINLHLDLVQYAEERGHFRVATRVLDSLAKQDNLSREVKNKLCYLEAHLSWSQNNQHIGQFLLNLLMNDNSASPSLRAQALCIFGNWVGKTESGNPQVIIKKYYQESIDTFLSIDDPTLDDLTNLYATQAALAHFSDMQYRQITDYIKSPQFKTLKSLAQLSNASSVSVDSKDIDLRRAISIYQKQSKNDAAELENFEKDKNTYLLLALEYYLKTLEKSRDHDFLVFRVVSLWLDNMHHANFNEILVEYLPKIASYKFVPLIPQLAPHMNLANDQFSSKINTIVNRCALEHPHHTLPVLLALKNLTGDSEFSNCQETTKDESKPRVKAAQKLINQLLLTKIRPIIEEMSQLSRSLVMLAYLELPKKRPNEKHTIPASQLISKIKNLNNIIIPTVTLSVKKSGNYDNIIGIREYKGYFVTVGGVNAPKRIECIGTDGISRKQLVKGQDDMRQDAVMQQVFTVINSLLSANKESKERKLNIRTYKVVPLTQRSGVLEWCENTIPIATILLGPDRNSGIHKKYYPEDYTGLECRRKMDAASKETNEMKLKTFLECCKNMHPAFHHFFTENYLSPEVWFERRLTYTRSVATTSIVGYILSVGDRHLQNILIDQTTAEVIHIDFGIAFEQGKLLSIPETVPFRLTRDIEVPMGVSGVEGVMRRCCELTLKLLQEQREIIVTLLQVLLYDPLFTWSISSSKAHKIQSSCSTDSWESSNTSLEINKFANRALLKVQQKLQGVEEGVTLSVEGQVERLIQQARDPSNLCLLFHGWQAYL